MRAVGKDLETCHVAEGAGLFPTAPGGKLRTKGESSRETDSAQLEGQQPWLSMPIHGGGGCVYLPLTEAASCHCQGCPGGACRDGA